MEPPEHYWMVVLQELEAIKARVREMEEEAEKIRQMQNEVEKQMNRSTSSTLSKHFIILWM